LTSRLLIWVYCVSLHKGFRWRLYLGRGGRFVWDKRGDRLSGIRALAAALVVAAGVAGCGSGAPQYMSGAPPTVVCGTVLNDSAAGAVMYDATRQLPIITQETVGSLLFFRVSPGCGTGVTVRWTPASAARLVKAAYARDGQMSAVVLAPSGPDVAFRLTGTRNGKVVATATAELAS